MNHNPDTLPEPLFRDPYDDLPDAVANVPNPPHCVHQTLVKISGYDRALMMAVHSGRPTIKITLSILVRHLCYELRKAGITEYNPAAYERAVAGLRITLGGAAGPVRPTDGSSPDLRSTAAHDESDRQATPGNDGRRDTGVARTPDSAPAKPADASRPRKRTRRVREKGTSAA